jgi:hypothetical protein
MEYCLTKGNSVCHGLTRRLPYFHTTFQEKPARPGFDFSFTFRGHDIQYVHAATETHDRMRNHDKDLSLSATPNCSSHLIRNHFCSRLITILAIVFVCVCTSSVFAPSLLACVPCFDFSSTFRRDDIRTRDYNRNPRSDAES